ncbi:MAG: 23S rRNA (adenine(2503)-C(2))-methyltransferase RlmN [Candidatus Magnetoovum sp. WYHC-5]|nr:23S rRNA (adenine(2503)-C(2))-methyltransferase RlmN [Candidatus Magnetoovum sp. WYHC-5]
MGDGYIDKVNLKELSNEQISGFLTNFGLPLYRVRQLIHWMYEKRVSDISEISEFSKSLRDELSKKAYISKLEIVSKQASLDGTVKYLFALEDSNTIESVLIPDEKRLTLCISSQVGCKLGCRFCLTGSIGFVRNLKAFEIVDQIMCVENDRHINNIVMMGMGEPLDNFDNVVEAIRRIIGLIQMSKRKITLSTAGIVPNMQRIFKMVPEINLAVSLNATTDDVRSFIMPINKRYSLSELIRACKEIPLSPRRRITFEYVMLEGINDASDDAKRLVKLLRGIKSKVNLIPLNGYNAGLKAPSEKQILAFQKILTDANMTAFIRKSRGSDILAACGQLKASY